MTKYVEYQNMIEVLTIREKVHGPCNHASQQSSLLLKRMPEEMKVVPFWR